MVECRTPAPGRAGVTRVPAWKYAAVRQAILEAVTAAGPEGLAFALLPDAVAARLTGTVRDRLGSVRWHVTTVKLNMEVEGELRRLPGHRSQRLTLGPGSG